MSQNDDAWIRLKVNSACELMVSHPACPLPEGISIFEDFLSAKEEKEILNEINEVDFGLEGFDVPRRVQHFSFGDERLPPPSLQAIGERVRESTGHDALDLSIEEYSVPKWSKSGEYASNSKVTTFESRRRCSCGERSCSCFVAYIPLRKSAVQHLHKPLKRLDIFWELETPDHWTDLYMKQRSLTVKTEDCLWNWRSQLRASAECSGTAYVLRFYSLPKQSIQIQPTPTENVEDNFGYAPSTGNAKVEVAALSESATKPLQDLLTIIVTTSPIKSNPSTEVIERAMGTFVMGGEDFAYKCRKVIVCDGARTKNSGSSISNKHVNTKQAMRNGIVTTNQAEDYAKYKENLRKLCASAPSNSPFNNAVVEELEERQGYGFALRHALRCCVTTPFVCVVQHDRTFMRPTPIRETLHCMSRHPGIKYVGMTMRSNLMYRDIFLSKFGNAYTEELKDMIQRPIELQVDKSTYGPNSKSSELMIRPSDKIQKSMLSMAATYQPSAQARWEREWQTKNAIPDDKHQMSLTPTLFWYDNVHVCETAHYRDFVFNPNFKMVARGGFVEDKLSPVLKRTLDRAGLREGHQRFGCFLLDDHSGMFFTGHLDGGAYMTFKEREDMLSKKVECKRNEEI